MCYELDMNVLCLNIHYELYYLVFNTNIEVTFDELKILRFVEICVK